MGGAGLSAGGGGGGEGSGGAGGADGGWAGRLRAVCGRPGGGGDRGQEGGHHADRGRAPDPQVPGCLSGHAARLHRGRRAALRLRVHRGRDPFHLRARPCRRFSAGLHLPPPRNAGSLARQPPRIRRQRHPAHRLQRTARPRCRPARSMARASRGHWQPGGVVPGQPPPGADPDGHWRGQDVHRGQRLLPPAAPRRGQPHPVPGRPGQPGPPGRPGVRGLRRARRPPQVHRAVQREAARLVRARHGQRGRRQSPRQHHPAPPLHSAGRGPPRRPRRAVGLRHRSQPAGRGGLQPAGADRVVRPHRHRRVPPLDLRRVAPGAGVLRRPSWWASPPRPASRRSPSSTRTW